MKQYEALDYDIITPKTVDLHKIAVQKMIDEGWSLEGTLVVNSKGVFIQAFSKPKRAVLR
jgi:hypothetical protein